MVVISETGVTYKDILQIPGKALQAATLYTRHAAALIYTQTGCRASYAYCTQGKPAVALLMTGLESHFTRPLGEKLGNFGHTLSFPDQTIASNLEARENMYRNFSTLDNLVFLWNDLTREGISEGRVALDKFSRASFYVARHLAAIAHQRGYNALIGAYMDGANMEYTKLTYFFPSLGFASQTLTKEHLQNMFLHNVEPLKDSGIRPQKDGFRSFAIGEAPPQDYHNLKHLRQKLFDIGMRDLRTSEELIQTVS